MKRSLFLFIVGLLYIAIWPADILHYYGIYLLAAAVLLSERSYVLVVISILLVIIYPILLDIYDYDKGWDWNAIVYSDFWTIRGFTRNLMINGFHPVVPWLAFLLVGMRLGRLNMGKAQVRNRLILFSFLTFAIVQILSSWLIGETLVSNPEIPKEDVIAIFGTQPMPPLPIYMISGTSFALLVIGICVYLADRWPNSLIMRSLICTGQMALTIYILHVVLGMGIIFVLLGEEIHWSIEYALSHAVIFSLVSIIFSYKWLLRYKRGPLEMLMRKITG